MEPFRRGEILSAARMNQIVRHVNTHRFGGVRQEKSRRTQMLKLTSDLRLDPDEVVLVADARHAVLDATAARTVHYKPAADGAEVVVYFSQLPLWHLQNPSEDELIIAFTTENSSYWESPHHPQRIWAGQSVETTVAGAWVSIQLKWYDGGAYNNVQYLGADFLVNAINLSTQFGVDEDSWVMLFWAGDDYWYCIPMDCPAAGGGGGSGGGGWSFGPNGTEPASPSTGDMFYNTTAGLAFVYSDGTGGKPGPGWLQI